MAAPMSMSPCRRNLNADNQDEVDGESSLTDASDESHVSNELLYPEKFTTCYQESKLLVVGKNGPASGDKQFKTFSVPQSSVMSRIKDFLPKLSQSNEEMSTKLSQEPSAAERFNVECVDSDEKPHIEMNLSMLPPEFLTIDDSEEESSSEEDDDVVCTGESSLHDTHSASALVQDMDASALVHDVDEPESNSLKMPGFSSQSKRKPRIEDVTNDQKDADHIT